MTRLFVRKGVWYLDYCANGRRIRESSKSQSKRVAELALASRHGEVVQGKFKLEKVQKSPRFSNFAETYIEWAKENKRSWARDAISINHLAVDFSHRRLVDIHPFHVEKYKTARKAEVSPATVNREVACLKRILNLAVKWGQLQQNPIREVRFFKEPGSPVHFLSEDEAARLIEACSNTLRPIVVTALNTGMRRGEILSLTWDRVNLRERFLTLVGTKNGESREVPLNRTMVELLASLPRSSEHVFTNRDGEPYHCVKKIYSLALRKAGIENFRFHDLRHTWASHLAMSGVDLLTVKELGGWKSLQMVQRYAHLSDSHRRRAVEVLGKKFSHLHGTNVAHGQKYLKWQSVVSN